MVISKKTIGLLEPDESCVEAAILLLCECTNRAGHSIGNLSLIGIIAISWTIYPLANYLSFKYVAINYNDFHKGVKLN